MNSNEKLFGTKFYFVKHYNLSKYVSPSEIVWNFFGPNQQGFLYLFLFAFQLNKRIYIIREQNQKKVKYKAPRPKENCSEITSNYLPKD